jgi:hypothetical protein
MTTSVTAVTTSRAVQLILRPIHHSIAQHITTGTMISGRNRTRFPASQRDPMEPPTPMLTAPPILTQVSVPSTFTNPAPNAAQELAVPAPFTGSCLPRGAALSGFRCAGGSAAAIEADKVEISATMKIIRITPVYRVRLDFATGRT